MIKEWVRNDLPRLGGLLIVAVLAMAASGCSSTLVVLVPDPNGKVGEVSVTNATGTRVLTAAG